MWPHSLLTDCVQDGDVTTYSLLTDPASKEWDVSTLNVYWGTGMGFEHSQCFLTAWVQESDVSTHSLFYWPSEYRNAMWASREESVFLCWLCISSSCCWVLETLGLSRVNNSFSSSFVKYLQFKLDSVSHCLKITYQSRLRNLHKVYNVHIIKSNLYCMHALQNSK